MTIERAVFTMLSQEPSLIALVGDRVYHVERPPESELPALEYMVTADGGDIVLDGINGMTDATADVYAYASTPDDLISIREALKTIANGYRGSAYGKNIQRATLRQTDALFLDDVRIHAAIFELTLTYLNT